MSIKNILVALVLILLLIIAKVGYSLTSQDIDILDPPKKIDGTVSLLVCEEDTAKKFIGTLHTSLQRHALIEDIKTKRHSLYKENFHIDNRFKIIGLTKDSLVLSDSTDGKIIYLSKDAPIFDNIKLIDIVKVDAFEYWYHLVSLNSEVDYKDFEFLKMNGSCAVLEKDYTKLSPPLEESFPEEAIISNKTRLNDESRKYIKISKALAPDEIFFDQLKTEKIDDNTWLVDGDSVSRDVVDNISGVAANVFSSVKGIGIGKSGVKVRFGTNSGGAILDKSGFLVNSLSPDVKEKAGLLNDDIIKKINGKPVSNLSDTFLIFCKIIDDNVKEVKIDFLRDNKINTNRYIIK
ncbi:MAG: hypothetical protein ABIG92_05895 [Candidatus Omnitrophota bacterium]